MAKLSSIVVCDGAVLSFGQWTLVGVTRTLWGEGLPHETAFSVYVCVVGVRRLTSVAIELFDPVSSAQGETGALKWRQDLLLEPSDSGTVDFGLRVPGVLLTRSMPHELHLSIDGNLADVVILDVIA